ncbi:Uncharacterised protein [[Flavobacterium] thermophilum]|nr:Uncharacterised protein [[Flavobacterium] thermophilum]
MQEKIIKSLRILSVGKSYWTLTVGDKYSNLKIEKIIQEDDNKFVVCLENGDDIYVISNNVMIYRELVNN